MRNYLISKELIDTLMEYAYKNKKAVNNGNIEESIETAGFLDGMTYALRLCSVGVAIGIVTEDNGCRAIYTIWIGRFEIWSRAELQEYQYEKALRYYSEK